MKQGIWSNYFGLLEIMVFTQENQINNKISYL